MSSTLFPPIPAGTIVSALMSIQLKNLDALAAAQKAAMEGMGSLAKQQQDILGARLTEATALPTTLLDSADPRAALAKPFDAMKGAILDGSAKGNLLGEIATRSSAQVAGILQDRLLAALDETKAALLQTVPARG